MNKSVKIAALRFLKIRPHSITELKEKLENKGFAQTEVEFVLHELIASGLLDDRAFTRNWINYRLARPFGFRRIIQELKLKGVDQGIIDQAVADVHGEYEPASVALELAERRWQRMPDIDLGKKKKRVLDFLLRRGFEAATAIKVLNELK